MGEIERQVEAAKHVLDVEVTPGDTARALVRLEGRRRRRRQQRIAVGSAATIAVAAALLFALRPAAEPEPTAAPTLIATPTPAPEPAPAPEPEAELETKQFATDESTPTRTVVFADGSMASLLEPDTELRLEALTTELLEVKLTRGEVRFAVEKNPQRTFRVRTPALTVEVLGTRFTVNEDPTGATEVRVEEGRVAVLRDDERHELGPGMRITVDGERAVIEDTRPVERKAKRRRKARRAKKRRRRAPARRWASLAADGRYPAAYDALRAESIEPVSAKDLMLAADVARLSGHPEEATTYLRRVVRGHADQPQGMLAAFTLGRILQRELRRPAQAAEAYRKARTLAPTGSLAEDALAHEAECRARAGGQAAARGLAEQYLRQYPDGRKASTMRRLIGPER